MPGSTSGARGAGDTASVPGSGMTMQYLLIILVLACVVLGGSLVHMGLGISAALQAGLAKPWPNNHSGLSRPLLPYHAALAAYEEAQLQAARARRGWRPISRVLSSKYNKRTHRRLPVDIVQQQEGGSPTAATGGAKLPPDPPRPAHSSRSTFQPFPINTVTATACISIKTTPPALPTSGSLKPVCSRNT